MSAPNRSAKHMSHEPIKVLVLEDHYMQRMGLKTMLTRQGYDAITAKNVEEAMEALDTQGPDIALLDISITHEDAEGGIRVGEYIRNNLRIPIIYLTGHQDKFDKAKLTYPNAFLNKDAGIANEHLILNQIDLAIHNFYGDQADLGNIRIGRKYILIKEEGVWEKVDIQCIMHFNARNNDSAVFLDYTRDTKIPKDFFLVSTMPFKSLKKHLPPARFSQIHRSHIVNLGHVKGHDMKQVILNNGDTLPISNGWREAFVEDWKRFTS